MMATQAMIGAPTPATEALMARKAQVFVHHAIDLYLGELARRGRSATTRDKYRRILDPFGDTVAHKLPSEVTIDDCRRFLDRWADKAPSGASGVSVLRGFFDFCRDEGIVTVSPAERLKRPARKRPEDLDVVTISTDDVRRMLAACADWQERICISVLFFMGVRRQAAANVRRRDVDLTSGHMRFREKGGKTITKPIPDQLLQLLRHADDQGQWLHGDEWLIPNRKPFLVKSQRARGHKVIYETVRRVADRAGLRAHPHSLRAAFAVQYDEQHPDQTIALKELLGHSRIETTMTYLRRKNKSAAMETVRDLSVFPSDGLYPQRDSNPRSRRDPADSTDGAVTGDQSLPDLLLGRARDQAKAEEHGGRVDDLERDRES